MYVGVAIALFGPTFLEIFAYKLLKDRWRSEEMVQSLTWYCYYLLVLGVNGVSEAFVQSITSPSDFWRVNVGLILSSGVFVMVAVYSVHGYGAGGVILANIVSMVLRIAWNLLYIQRHRDASAAAAAAADDDGRETAAMTAFIPGSLSWWVGAVCCKVSIVVSYFYVYKHDHLPAGIRAVLLHLSTGVVAGLVYVYVTFRSLTVEERQYVTMILKRRKDRAKTE